MKRRQVRRSIQRAQNGGRSHVCLRVLAGLTVASPGSHTVLSPPTLPVATVCSLDSFYVVTSLPPSSGRAALVFQSKPEIIPREVWLFNFPARLAGGIYLRRRFVHFFRSVPYLQYTSLRFEGTFLFVTRSLSPGRLTFIRKPPGAENYADFSLFRQTDRWFSESHLVISEIMV